MVEIIEIDIIASQLPLRTEKLDIRLTPEGIKKNAKLSKKKLLIPSTISNLIILVHNKNNRISIPSMLPGIGRLRPFFMSSPKKYILRIIVHCLNSFTLTPSFRYDIICISFLL